MEKINQIKLRLKKFIGSETDKSILKPVKILMEGDKFCLILQNSQPPYTYHSAKSLDGFNFNLEENVGPVDNFVQNLKNAAVVTNYLINKRRIAYFGDRRIYLATLAGKKDWIAKKKPLISSAKPTEVGGAFLFPNGIIILYFEKIIENGLTYYKAHLAEFDKKFPDRLLWITEEPIWNSKTHWPDKKIIPLGSVMLDDNIIIYWYVDEKIIFGVSLTGFFYKFQSIRKAAGKLHKYHKNPIIAPRPENNWEAFNTLNPAASYINNKVHILYRAQGYDYISSVGYAVSSDGTTIDNRLNYPIYRPTAGFETNTTGKVNPELISAGGWGGCEDPRITLIDGRVFMIYVAFDGWSNLRLALTSIDLNDFLNQRWNWEKPVLISPPGVIDKSGCLLSEKIRGKYVFFHRIFPNILIDYVDDLTFKNRWLKGRYQIKIRPGKWDSRKIGAGAPPLKTKDGWLLIYYGVDDKDAGKYHIGSMLLDLENPYRVLHRSSKPILSPQTEYENNGFKPGITYPCGAVIIKDELFVYYGAADSVVCVARANLNKFLADLKADSSPRFDRLQINEVHF